MRTPHPSQTLALLALTVASAGCSTLYSYTNEALPETQAQRAALPPVRATLNVNGGRGNPRVLMFLALSGGGSRASYFSAAAMWRLHTAHPDVDLLAEVDVMSAVSGGSLAAAYYAVTRDVSLRLPEAARRLAPALGAPGPLSMLSVDTVSGTIACNAPLHVAAVHRVTALLADDPRGAALVTGLCGQTARKDLRVWERDSLLARMRRNYVNRMLGNFFWPNNIVRYWFTAYDRADIMAQTFADNLFDTPLAGLDLSMADLNPERPFLILNSTNASEQTLVHTPQIDEMPFGSVFTFTDEDFTAHAASNVRSYSLARAVMASSAFPVVFPAMTLRDYRPDFHPACRKVPRDPGDYCEGGRYLHVFDGGNSDNLGLKSIKRVLLNKAADRSLAEYDRVIVLLVDAFATPPGTARKKNDPRNWFDRIADLNVVDAVDSLLRANRGNLINEFNNGQLAWNHEDDCIRNKDESRELPRVLCERLIAAGIQSPLALHDKLVFYHVGFDDLEGDPALRKRLNQISTSFSLGGGDVAALDAAVDNILHPDNPCIQALAGLVQRERASTADVSEARAKCKGTDKLPPGSNGAQRK